MKSLFKTKTLFILKKRTIYSDLTYSTVNSGLYNSATFVHNMLLDCDIKSNLVEVNDNNEIDKFVTKYRPEYVIIEALWVVPSKFEVLEKRHPSVNWIIRIHSEIPFIANEGIAIEWLKGYSKFKNVIVSGNSEAFNRSMEPILGKPLLYLPNYYPTATKRLCDESTKDCSVINIGLFGAIRPMKNSLTQAIAAIIYADNNNKKLRLHINTARVEQKGENALKNVRALFEGTNHELVEHKWLKHSDFLQLVRTMDVGLQVSLSETYNIVTADFVSQYIPVVTSQEIPFINSCSKTDSTKDAIEIVDKIKLVLLLRVPFTIINKLLLMWDSRKSKKIWRTFFNR